MLSVRVCEGGGVGVGWVVEWGGGGGVLVGGGGVGGGEQVLVVS